MTDLNTEFPDTPVDLDKEFPDEAPKHSLGGDLMDGYFAQKQPEARVLDAFGQGFKDNWGAVDTYEQNTLDYLNEKGLGKDALEKRQETVKAFNQAFMRSPVHYMIQGLKPVAGLVGGLGAAGVQFGKELVGGAHALEELKPKPTGAVTATTGQLMGAAAGVLGETGEIFQASSGGEYLGDLPMHVPEARSVGAIGESHEKFLGTEKLTVTDEQARAEATGISGTSPPPPPMPSIHDIARQVAPDTFYDYDILRNKHNLLLDNIRDTTEARANDPRVVAAQTEIDTILGKVNGVESKLTKKAAERLADIRGGLEDFLSIDTPEMKAAKEAHSKNYQELLDLAPDIRTAYREAQSRLPQEPTRASEEPVQTGPKAAQTLDTGHEESVSTTFTEAQKAAAENTALKPTEISDDISRRFQGAGKPKDVSDAAGRLTQAYYETKAARFEGKLGTAEDIYKKDNLLVAGETEPPKEGVKGSYTSAVDGSNKIIRLFKGSDASTVVHEIGHSWLDDLIRDAAHPDAPEQLKKDLQTVQNWMGVKEGKKINRTQHERWARGVERYLMEGIAPNKELASVFEKFKDWLSKIYKTLAELKSPISDDIRKVFDRLLHTDQDTIIAPEEAREETPRAVSPEAVYPDGKLSDGSKPEATQYLQSDGTFNLEEIKDYPSLIAALKQHGEVNDLRYSATKGKWSDDDVINVKNFSGLSFNKANMNKLAATSIEDGIPVAARVRSLGVFFEQNAKEIQRVLAMDNPATEDIIKFTEAVQLHRRAAETLLGVRGEWGRTGRALNEMLKSTGSDEELGSLLQQTIGLDYYQVKKALAANKGLSGTQKISKLVQNMQKPSFGQNMFMYFTNNLVSGPITHMTYAMSITGNIVYRSLIESPGSAAVGSLMHVFNKDRPRVTWGEVGDELHKMWFGTFDGVRAAKAALKQGTQQGLQAEHLISEKVQHEIDTGKIQEGSRDSRQEQLQGKIDEFKKNYQLSDIDKDLKRASEGKDRKIPSDFDEVFPILAKSEPPQSFELNPSNAKNRYYKMGEAPGSSKVSEIAGKVIRGPGERFVAPVHSINYTISLASNLRKFVSRQARLEGEAGNWTPRQVAIRMADLQNNTPLDIIKQAKSAALEENLLNPSKPGDALTLFKRLARHEWNVPVLGKTPWLGFAQPFVSIISRAAEMGVKSTLVGNPVTWVAYKDIRQGVLGKNGPVAQDLAISKILLGTAVTSSLWGLAEQGILNEPAPDDPKERFVQQMYTGLPDGIKIGDMTLDTQRLGGTGLRIALVSDMHRFMKDGDKDGYNEAFVTMLHDIGHHFMQTTAISGLGSLFEAIDDPGRFGKNYWNGFLSTMTLPYSIGQWQTAKYIDPYQRETQTGDRSGVFSYGEWNALKKSFEEKIPLIRQTTLYPKVDVFGQPLPSPDFYGVYVQKVSNDPVYQVFKDTPYFPGPVPKQIKGYTLSEEQYHEFATLAGVQAHQLLTNTINIPGFNNFIPTIRHDMLMKDIKQARAQALSTLEAKYPELPKESVRLKKEIAELGAQADKEKELGE